VQPFRRLGGHPTGVEVGLQGGQQLSGAAAGLRQRAEYGVHQVDDGGLVAQHHPVGEQVMGVDDRVVLVTRLLHTFPQAPPAGPVVVACRSVLAAPADQDAIRRVVTAVFAPSRVLLIETVRAAAIGSGAAAGVLLVVDVGAQLTEVAVLVDGRLALLDRWCWSRSSALSTPPRREARQYIRERRDAGIRVRMPRGADSPGRAVGGGPGGR
jgi:hypothetical protein